MAKHLSGSGGRGKRRGGGFRHAGGYSGQPLRKASSARGFAETRVLTDWDAILGPKLARTCRPVKISYATRGGLGAELIVHAEGPSAPEVEMRGPQIVERINSYYGYRAVSRIRITQIPPQGARETRGYAAGFAEPSRGFDRTGAVDPATISVSENDARAVETTVSGVEDDSLKQALTRLGLNISRAARRR